MEHGLATDIAVCIIAAWVVAVASQALRQPLLLAYLLAGFAIGPHGFRWITDVKDIATISEIGLSLLLFMIGLEIDLKKMLSAGKSITITAAVQIIGCVLLGWLAFNFLGPAENRLEALYLAVAAAMSSTVIIVKILYDKRELETLAGRVTLGKPVAFHGEGGSIPFMAMLGHKFPGTQFVVTGVLGPHANAHGPNEFLHIATAKRVCASIAQVVAAHARR